MSDFLIILVAVQAFSVTLTSLFTAFQAYKAARHATKATAQLEQTNVRLQDYRLEINSRMDQFIALTKLASFAEGKLSGTPSAEDVLATARDAAAVLAKPPESI
jgi:hypothetical protein